MLGLKNIVDFEQLKKSYTRVNVYDARSELGYQAKRSGAAMVVRKVADLGAQVIENSADVLASLMTNTVGSVLQFVLGRELAQNLGLFAGAASGRIAGIAGIGLASGISAGFAQMDYFHQKSNLRRLYADELGAKLGKAPRDVTVRDMERLAKDYPVLEEELRRARKQRNFAIPLAVAATLASYAAVNILLPGLPVGDLLKFLVSVAVSMATYAAVKIPLQKLGNRLFGLHEETANDRIVDIVSAHAKGMDIQADDLTPVFAKTHPQMAQEQLERLAGAINNGSIRATELTFAGTLVADEPAGEPVAQENAQPKNFAERLGNVKHCECTFAERVAQHSAEVAIGIS